MVPGGNISALLKLMKLKLGVPSPSLTQAWASPQRQTSLHGQIDHGQWVSDSIVQKNPLGVESTPWSRPAHLLPRGLSGPALLQRSSWLQAGAPTARVCLVVHGPRVPSVQAAGLLFPPLSQSVLLGGARPRLLAEVC